MGKAIGPRGVYVKPSPTHGLGVFARAERRPGALLEVSPVLVVRRNQVLALRETMLFAYYFWWPKNAVAIALGYGSLYNHSYRPTARFDLDIEQGVILFTAIRPIQQDQEITINYNGDPGDATPVWFDLPENGHP
jgi:SET domain-containing protein